MLAKLLLHDDVVEQLSFLCKFEHEIDCLLLVESVFQAQDVRMADAHEHGDLLLQAVRLGSLLHARCLGENLDGVALTGRLFDTQEHFGKVALAEPLEQGVLLQEGAGGATLGVPEDEARPVEHGNLVLLLKLSPLVAPDNALVDKCAIAR